MRNVMAKRRDVLKGLTIGLGATYAAVSRGECEGPQTYDALQAAARQLPDATGARESFWEQVREQFVISPGLVLLNAANLCPSPHPVTKALFEVTQDIDANPSFENRAKFEQLRDDTRQRLARVLGADSSEVALVRNTSEGNNMVINGLTLGRDDEVLLWDQNHESNLVSWDVRAQRHGFKVRRIQTPAAPRSPEELIAPFVSALTDKTRVLSFSHVSNVSGVQLPAQQICRHARTRNVLTLVDGAQTFAVQPIDLHAIGCDFYTASAHKWLMGPREIGVLYVRRESIQGLWPSTVSLHWDQHVAGGARKFECLGQQAEARMVAFRAALEFHDVIGAKRIALRIRSLTHLLRTGLQDRIRDVHFMTPAAPESSLGIVVFTIAGLTAPPREVMAELYQKHRISCLVSGGETPVFRFCPHIYNSPRDIKTAIEAVEAVASST